MGSVAKVIKKVARIAKKPFSKITKGIARGIAKVGKAVMRGVGKLSNKLGPVGMIALSIAMPYALTALGGGATGGLIGLQGGATGWMNSTNVFLKSIGNVGNAIRTGYQATTGAISRTFSTITRSISEGFSSMGRGNNIFSRISNGAKNLFKNARATIQKLKPFTSPGGSVDVTGQFAKGPASWGTDFVSQTMTNVQAQAALESGLITGDQLIGQSWGKTGWLTKANPMDKAISETINSTYESNIMSNFDGSARKAFLDYKKAADASGQNYNYQSINNIMKDNMTNIDSGSIGFDFNKSGDYYLANPNEPTSYTFNGKKSFNVNGKSTLEKVKSAAKGTALDKLQTALLTKSDKIIPDVDWSLMGDTTQQTEGATTYGGTNIFGSWGGSLLEGVYDKDQQERIMNYYKHMNIVGSH